MPSTAIKNGPYTLLGRAKGYVAETNRSSDLIRKLCNSTTNIPSSQRVPYDHRTWQGEMGAAYEKINVTG